MRKKMVNAEYPSLDMACRRQGEEQIKKMLEEFTLPEVCTKPDCECNKFLRHEDGWQCLNCFKIIYVKQCRGNRRKKNRQLVLV